MSPVVIPSLAQARDFQGTDLGATDWITLDQERIDGFAAATGDQRWIHVDPQRATRESPWRATIADGYLLLSLVPSLLTDLLVVKGWSTAINIGVNDCAVLDAVPAGSRVRMAARLARARPLAGNGCRLRIEVWYEMEGRQEPCFRATVDYAYFA